MDGRRTEGWYVTRFVLGVAIGLILTGGWLAWYRINEVCFGCDDPILLGVPASLLIALAALLFAVVGLVWMIRIFRGPRDEPPRWRYRDR